jgi:hypothetical protein
MVNHSRNRILHYAAAGTLCLFVAAGWVFPNQQTKQSRRSAKPAAHPTPAPPVSPFHPGETLDFSGEWLKINNTISARLIAANEATFFGKLSWHLQAQLHTNNPLRMLFPLDDQFDSYSAANDFQGFQFEMYLHESGKDQTNLLRLSSGTDNSAVPPGATVVRVLPETRDPLGFLYDLRSVNWSKTPEVSSPVFDGHNLYDVHAQMTTPSASTQVAAGTFTATGIAVHVLQKGVEMKDTKLTLWIAQDAARTPVLLEMELPIGYGRIELVHSGSSK